MNVLSPALGRTLMLCLIAGTVQSVHAGNNKPLVCLIQPSGMAEVGSPVTGVIERLRVERGDRVKKGQVIAVLRNDVERAALNVAQSRAQAEADVQAAIAGLEFARQSTARGEDLFRKKFISEQALDKTRTEEKVALQKLAQAREQRRTLEREMGLAKSQLAQRTIISPINGIVAERYLSVGERVEDRSIVRIVSINPLHVEVMVPAADFGKISAGMPATVSPELPNLPPMQAQVSLVDKLIDGASNTFRVRLELPNPDHAIPAGPRCKVAFGDPSPVPAQPALRALPSAGAQLKLATPSQPAQANPEQAALDALENWRKAWESKNTAGYLAAYVSTFQGSSPNRDAWIKQREARIQKPGARQIRISDTQVLPLDQDRVKVQFRQTYRADRFRSSTNKQLQLVRQQDKWLILEERVLP